ncbi:MAG: pitrilysin family protein [Bacteroidota bacterium]|nr:pitrilysin family protein [Bacteroidota bacterium]MDP4232723.1 pitrilysin family protein [Bacteroidota bacterium]MDP4243144.1 pitrilysin family protein [Bacteroidota bacterium]MDP4287601.1 pitrilysin family protein [Bacteroidota bacterium]
MQDSKNTPLDRSRPPEPGPLPKIAFPPFEARRLSNGLSVYIVEDHEQPILSIALYLRAGAVLDPHHTEGLAATVADMLTKGTKRRSATQIAEEIDFVGGSLMAGTSWDALTIGVNVLSKYTKTALDILGDVVQNSTYPAEELERVRLQRLAGLRQAKADAGFLADMVFAKLVFANHPYGKQAMGTTESIERIQQQDVISFANDYFGPENAFLVAAGDVRSEDFMRQLEDYLGSWRGAPRIEDTIAPAPVVAGRHVGLIDKEGAVQSAIRIGNVGIPRNTPDYIPLTALNTLLGGYFNSRINLNLREVHGFTYGARSGFDARILPGPFAVSTEVRTEVTVRSAEEIVSELTRITSDFVTEEELRMVKNYMIGNFPLQLETPQQIASRIAMIVLYGLDRDYYDTYRDKLATLTVEDLYRVSREYLNPSDLVIVASGNVQAIEAGMAEFGEIEIFDEEGERMHAPVTL